MSQSRCAVLLDGGFVIKKLSSHLRRFPASRDVECLCERILSAEDLQGHELLRIYFYHAPPAKAVLINPLDNSHLNLATSPAYARHKSLLDAIELKPSFALRLGEVAVHEWRLGTAALGALTSRPRTVEARDLVPNITQKGVDLRIGLDIARLSLRRLAETVVVVTGDSDLVPAFRFARREGLRVYLDHLGHGIARDLKAHCDRTLPNALLGLECAQEPAR